MEKGRIQAGRENEEGRMEEGQGPQQLPTEYVLNVSPFPNPEAVGKPVRLRDLVRGKATVIHMYTG